MNIYLTNIQLFSLLNIHSCRNIDVQDMQDNNKHFVARFTVLCMQQFILAHCTFAYQYIPRLVHFQKLDGCIVWNAHNTVLGEEAVLIYIVPVCYIKTGRYGKTY